ncbi:MAG: hypothetical protein ACRDOK_20185 [Streptosporangiaceae bacterium]
MSVSDPAPLPRLGEVFFDVRGNSRSMRLSWYADTGVAVFSIWQAGMCTGTFRLPMADLSRMTEILERGPAPQGRGRAPVSAVPHGEDRGSDSDWYYGPAGDEPARPAAAGNPGGYGADYATDYGRPGYEADYGRSERGPAEYGGGERRSPDYGTGGYGHAGHGGAADQHTTDFDARYGGSGGYGPADYGAVTDRAADERYQGGGYGSAGQAGSEDHRAPGYPADYGRGEYGEGGGYRPGYEPAGYGPGGYGTGEADYRTGEYSRPAHERQAGADRGYLPGDYDDRQQFRPGDHRRDDSGFQRGAGSQAGTETDGSGYRDERFVAPYAGDGGQTYPNDNPAPGSGYQGDIGDAAYPADRRPVSPSDRYLEPSAPQEAYSYGAEYRHG